MFNTEDFARLVAMVNDLLASALLAADPMPPIALGVKLVDGQVVPMGAMHMKDPAFLDPENVASFVRGMLDMPELEALAVVHETWISAVKGAPAEAIRERMGHLRFGPDGRAEAVVCALHTKDFQTAVLHGVSREGGVRRLIPGPLLFEGVSLGGRMARDMPPRH